MLFDKMLLGLVEIGNSLVKLKQLVVSGIVACQFFLLAQTFKG